MVMSANSKSTLMQVGCQPGIGSRNPGRNRGIDSSRTGPNPRPIEQTKQNGSDTKKPAGDKGQEEGRQREGSTMPRTPQAKPVGLQSLNQH